MIYEMFFIYFIFSTKKAHFQVLAGSGAAGVAASVPDNRLEYNKSSAAQSHDRSLGIDRLIRKIREGVRLNRCDVPGTLRRSKKDRGAYG